MRRLIAASLLVAAALHGQAIRSNAAFNANNVPRNDDGSSALVPLGFTLNFFGRIRTHTYVNNNGNVTFDAALATFTPFGLEGTRREIIAAFFGDVDTRDPGSKLVTYGQDTINGRRAFGVNYIDVGYYLSHADKLNSFQIILIERSDTGEGNFDIEFNYQRIAWETGDASGGQGGFGGVPAAVGWSNGSGEPGTSFELDGSLEPSALLDGGRRALNRNRLNSNVAGRYIFRGRGGRILPPLTIVTGCPLPTAFVGTPYAQRLTAVGANRYSWSWVADPGGVLPAGMTLSSDGLLSGTPAAAGPTEFTIRLVATTEDGDQTASKRCSINVQAPVVTITSACPLPQGTVGQNYSRTLQAFGGRAPYSWSLADNSSALPAGLALTSNGTITGVPRVAGTTIVTLQASSNAADGGLPATKSCSLTINPTILELTSACSLSPATAGVPYSQTLTVSGGTPPYQWSTTGAPTGLTLSSDGVLSGVPALGGGAFQVRVRDARGVVNEQVCSLPVNQALVSVTTACPLPNGTTGQPYSQRLQANGGTAPYTWSALTPLPSGLTLSGDGVLSGHAGGAGRIAMRFLVTDSAGNAGTAGCTMLVEPAAFSITSCPLPNGSVGVEYLQYLRAAGGVAPYTFSAVSGLPAGLSVQANGIVTGRPRESGTLMVSLRVMDSQGRTATQPCTLPVNPSPLTISGTCPLPVARIGTPYSQRFTASGGSAPYRFRLDGQLPSGLELTADGLVRGTPLAPAKKSFEIEAVDAQGRSVPLACSLDATLPDLPAMRLSALPASLPAAANGPTATLDLTRSYPLPIQGELVVSIQPDTGSLDPAVDRADPRVRFSNGQQRVRFTIPAGSTQFSSPIVSTGTVAGTVTVQATDLKTGGTQILAAPAPRQVRVPRAVPTLTDACIASSSTGSELRITGHTTTRQLQEIEFSFTAGKQQTVLINVAASAAEYFSSDESVRNGGAFMLTTPLIIEGTGTLQPGNLTLSNSVGTSASRSVTACR